MIRFIETIRIADGVADNLEYHRKRYNHTIRHHYQNMDSEDFILYISRVLNNESMKISKGLFKLRVTYTNKPLSYTLEPYYAKEIRSLRLVENNGVDYSFKYENRSAIEALFLFRGDCDDILIVKNGYITDTSYCNIVFEKDGHFFTPSTPLLAGTKRERLINEGMITEEKIRPCDICRYDKVYLINSMLDFVQVEKITL